jgi:predicted unusual protein kinase regulating ubiquinone biosynthesis (AarF/ABC1/UbiB family)
VHRAKTHGGDHVAVKVQYPGIDKAIENDLKSLSLLESMMSPVTKKLNSKQTLDEIRTVFMSELDYTREAEMADLFRRMNAGDPDVHVIRASTTRSPRAACSRPSSSAASATPSSARRRPEETRDRAGETIWRFTFRSLLRHGVLYADPHPGNYRFLGDGRVAFLDFGCVKELPPELVAGMKRYMRAGMDADWEELDRALVEVLGYDPNDESWDLYRSYTIELLMPIMTHDLWECTQARARETVAFLARGIKGLVFKDGEKMPNIPVVPKMPQDFTFVNRLQWGLASVLAGMGTRAHFRAIIEPWVRDGLHPIPS